MSKTEKLKVVFEADLKESPVAMDWSSNGRWLAVMNVKSFVFLVDSVSGRSLPAWQAHEDDGLALAWHPNLAMFATSCQRGIVKFWSVQDDQTVSQKTELQLQKNSGSNWVEFLKWRPDGKQLAAGVGNSVELVSLEGTIDSSYAFPDGTVADVSWHHKGSLLGVSGYGGIFIYNLSDHSGNPINLKRPGSILSISWSPDGKYIVAGCQDNSVHLWRFRTREDAQMTGFAYKPLQLKWCDRGKRLLTSGTSDLVIWPFDKKGPEGRSPETRPFHDEAICSLAVSAKGNSIASGCRGGRIAIWNLSGKQEPETWAAVGSRVEHLLWSPEKGSKTLSAASREGILKLFDASEAV